MMGEIVEDRHTVGLANQLEPALDPGEPPQRQANPLGVDAHLGRNGQRGQRVPDVVRTEQRHFELAEDFAVAAAP
jgi:hypothetical protein